MKRLFVKASIGAAGLVALLVPLQGCTDLNETPPSLISTSNFFTNEAEVLAALAGVYAQLRTTAPEGGGSGSLYRVNEVSSDEVVVPIRGPDWNDNGQWIELHNMTWTATSIATTNFFNYLLMDFFGGVPIVTTTELGKHPRNTRREVFDFIEKELIAARDSGLPATRPVEDNGRFTQGGVDAILANMYLNAGVFTKEGAGSGGINATAYNSCTGVTVSGGQDACLAADSAATRLLNSPYYQLADSFPQNFRADNNNSPENIFVVKFIAADGLGMDYAMAILHYNQYAPLSPWNGFAIQAQTYNAFDSTDKRRRVVLIGPQNDVLSGAFACVRPGCAGGAPDNYGPVWESTHRLIFTDTIHNIRAATEGEGGRIYKWPADPNHVAQNSGNDFAWFRLGEIYLIKAEALNEQTPGSGAALTLLNNLRARPGDPVNTPLAGPITRAMILSERLFELFGESKRRQDLIRFGQYTGRTDAASGIVGGKVGRPDYYVLMPIPQAQVNANPQLAQNPGY
ncbi:MAG: hypothetical protein AUG74_12650 [Bacteroidetes bacterium 13_1_20CM_4_60_6]|nr:MAG: hypothetical protein AUG74_12650 [Bacteroidetes bacterium 13_1_20CM_4_60_6]